MLRCDHEEADTRIIVYVRDSLQRSDNHVKIRTVHTDVIVILIGRFYSFCELNPRADIWVALGIGKQFRYYHINVRCEELGGDKSMSLHSFHALTGCDSTSFFFFSFFVVVKARNLHGLLGYRIPMQTEVFLHFVTHPYELIDCTSPHFSVLERFTLDIVSQRKHTLTVNEAHKVLAKQKLVAFETQVI